MVKTVLAYGDSLTFGTNALTGGRHAHEDQWPTVLEAGLGQGVRVVNAGLGGRTTMFDDHGIAADRNGARILPTILATFEPIDLVILMLGTNDMKTFICGAATGAGQGMKRLVEIVRTHPYSKAQSAPQVIVVAPPLVENFGPTPELPLLASRTRDIEKLADIYAKVAAAAGVEFFDAARVASPKGGGDGVHLDVNNTRALGEALVPLAARLLDTKARGDR